MSSEAEQTKQFCNELDRLVEHFIDEYDLTYAAVIGSLQAKIIILVMDAQDRYDEEQGYDDDDE